ncbi:zeta toxin family protein [Paenibacillus sp. P96]|uniref:UDP-N-acetylglucosamine kinase n=1 Tax=Paenibacillus zeirhizosphaerae TaxID=2987519 RepID=A0ABT9FU93_9BACL|nr:zeta toxin family protein [Paenibacillus sp. P96]MDP4098244.1 zeta toxin family protein [Paenibacillus sp. P96]
MSDPNATMFVFAGNNGSGKSTIRNLLIDKLGVSVNIDPDALARRIDRDNPDRRKVSAGKEAIKLARDCIKNRRDFTVETTLAGGNVIRQMREAKDHGFEVIMFFVGLGDYRLNIERVAARVRNGGHHIENADIIRRHQTSMDNLLSHFSLIDHLIVIDNSSADGVIVLEANGETIRHHVATLPDWVQVIDRHLQNKVTDH